MKKLIEALHVIQDECDKHESCNDCPIFKNSKSCGIKDEPTHWKINDEIKVLL